jgi:hypothetical protein
MLPKVHEETWETGSSKLTVNAPFGKGGSVNLLVAKGGRVVFASARTYRSLA